MKTKADKKKRLVLQFELKRVLLISCMASKPSERRRKFVKFQKLYWKLKSIMKEILASHIPIERVRESSRRKNWFKKSSCAKHQRPPEATIVVRDLLSEHVRFCSRSSLEKKQVKQDWKSHGEKDISYSFGRTHPHRHIHNEKEKRK